MVFATKSMGSIADGVDRATILSIGEPYQRRYAVATFSLNGYIVKTDAIQRDDGWMPSATIRDDRDDVDTNDVTDDYRVIAPEDLRFATREEAIDRAEVLGRVWVAEKG